MDHPTPKTKTVQWTIQFSDRKPRRDLSNYENENRATDYPILRTKTEQWTTLFIGSPQAFVFAGSAGSTQHRGIVGPPRAFDYAGSAG